MTQTSANLSDIDQQYRHNKRGKGSALWVRVAADGILRYKFDVYTKCRPDLCSTSGPLFFEIDPKSLSDSRCAFQWVHLF